MRIAFLVSAVLWLLIALALSGCATAPVNVIGGCEVPAQYDVTKSVGPDLPAGTKSKAFAEAATGERGQHKQDVDDFNGFRKYVKDSCQGGQTAPTP